MTLDPISTASVAWLNWQLGFANFDDRFESTETAFSAVSAAILEVEMPKAAWLILGFLLAIVGIGEAAAQTRPPA